MVKKKMPPHIVLQNGMWRFVKRGQKTKSFSKGRNKKRYVSMARRGRRKRYYSRAKRIYSRARGGGKAGVTKNIIDGVIVGVAQTALPDVIPMQDSLICLGVGWFRKNPTLVTLGGVQLGAQLGGMVGGTLGGNKGIGFTSQV